MSFRRESWAAGGNGGGEYEYYQEGDRYRQEGRQRAGYGHQDSRHGRTPPQNTWSQPYENTSSCQSYVQPLPAPTPTMPQYSHQPYQQYQHQQVPSALHQLQPVYQTPTSMETSNDEPRRKRYKNEHSPDPPPSEDEQQTTTIEDPLYLRQQLIDNSIALMHVLCPAAYGPHNQCHWTLVMLLRARNPDIWRGGIAADGQLVIEGPDGTFKAEALNMLDKAISAKLARSIKRSWVRQSGDDGYRDAETEVETDRSGAKFASERQTESW